MSRKRDHVERPTETESLNSLQEISDGLGQETDCFDLSSAQATELDRRLAQHRLDPSGGAALDELVAKLGIWL